MVLSAIQGLYEACKSVLLSTGQPVDEAPRMQGSGNHFWIYSKQLYMLFSRLEPKTSRLYGDIAPKLSFSPNEPLSEEALEKVRARLARPVKHVRNGEMSAPCGATVLYPSSFKAITPRALFDIQSPPHSSEDGQHCTYFRKFPRKDLQGIDKSSGIMASEVA